MRLTPNAVRCDAHVCMYSSQVFIPQVRKITSKPILLIMDNCGGHDPLALDWTKQYGVRIETLPPNTTSKLQPLDAGCVVVLMRARRTHLV